LVDLNDATKKQAKVIGIQPRNSQTNIKFQHVTSKNPRKRVVQNKFNYKSRGRTTGMPCLELEGAFSPMTGGVLITPWICITSPFLFFGGPCETLTSFSLRARE